jgi:cell division protein FtsB
MEDQYYRRTKSRFDLGRSLKKLFGKPGVLLTVGIAVPAVLFMLFSNKGILRRMALESDKQVMLDKIRQTQAEQQALQQQSKALDTDPKAIEKVAREKFGMIKEGETVYRVKRDR